MYTCFHNTIHNKETVWILPKKKGTTKSIEGFPWSDPTLVMGQYEGGKSNANNFIFFFEILYGKIIVQSMKLFILK